MTEEEAKAWIASHVSRETLEALDTYAALVQKWQRAINLVSKSSLNALYSRHMADSLQVFHAARQTTGTWLDIGSGGGFPGLVCAIAAKEAAPELSFVFIESDGRKASFLRDVSRNLDLGVTIHAERIEAVPNQEATVLSARALAPLVTLCELGHRHLAPDGIAIFPKGRNHAVEQAELDLVWKMQREILPSQTDPHAVIYRIGGLSRV